MFKNEAVSLALQAPTRSVKGRVALIEGATQSDTFTYDGALQSIELDRTGEAGKFFGFGYCQKAKIKLRDKDRAINLDKNNHRFDVHFSVDVNGTITWHSHFPRFIITEIERDENSNGLTVVGYDKIYNATKYTVADLGLEVPYTIQDVAVACANKLGISAVESRNVADSSFSTNYENGANFDGTESLRVALNAIAEATQTIYYLENDKLIFKRLGVDTNIDYTIDKSQYFTLDSKTQHTLIGVCSATELGDNIVASLGGEGEIQYVRDNPFWELREDVDALVRGAMDAMGGISSYQFDCSWRGNFLLEIGDKVGLIAKDGAVIKGYLLNDTLTYNGGMSQKTDWTYAESTHESANPSTLGEVLKQTFAKVDKVNKQIDIVASEATANSERISELQINTETISASVSQMEQNTNDALVGVHEDIVTLKNQVNASITAEDVRLEIETELANGVDKVVTSTGFTFNEEGLTVAKTGTEMKTTVTEDGMTVYRDNTSVLTANHNGVDAANLHATTYLIIGTNSRFEDYNTNRTGCFWIGG